MFDRAAHKREWDKQRDVHHRRLIQRWKRKMGCAQCGFKSHHVALQLDHIDPMTKDSTRNMRQALNYKWNKARIKKELAKCQVLCANCHAIRTWNEGHYSIKKTGLN